ncbi:outer membrane lipoprotein-sorting protein [Candidatus Haliotispira prima]|uniref:Outer membrane lipoprotein-sorting protein n=1 Tax=Candidatus Haliotispira prima TaxID=3034016 RepID=A0ABY8MGY6_9SPIO|nr:outer membrane lipoprotein-sorting protein [Candidatus Haliotispira prima]WGK69276.1 outer membrane lipoprotein-sorting protein [Candidatus Haliotispira prima]
MVRNVRSISNVTGVIIAIVLVVFAPHRDIEARNELGSPEDVMRKVEGRDRGNSSKSHLVLQNIRGSVTEERTLQNYTRLEDDYEARLLFVENPPNLQGTSYLIHDYSTSAGPNARADKGTDNDRIWNYLPSVGQTKRIALDEQSQKFLGSEFSFADLNRTNWQSYVLRFVKQEYMLKNGEAAWVISAVPNAQEERRTGYTKVLVYVQKSNFVIVQAVYDLQGRAGRKFMQVAQLSQIQGIWTPQKTVVTTLEPGGKRRSSKMTLRDIEYNVKLPYDFGPGELKR